MSRREQLEILAVATLPMHLRPDNAERLAHIFGKVKDVRRHSHYSLPYADFLPQWVSKTPTKNTDPYGACNPIFLLAELQVISDLRAENKDVSPPHDVQI